MLKTKEEMPSNKAGVGVIIGRFQVTSLHEGHKELILSVLERHEKLVILIGLSPLRATKNNPLDFDTRRRMIETEFQNGENIVIRYINDEHSDETWSRKLDTIISSEVPPGEKAILYGSRDSFISHYSGRYKTKELLQEQVISGSELRKKQSLKSRHTEDFRAGVIWATNNQYDTSYCAVDIAIWKESDEGTMLLLGKKDNEQQYRLIGGFTDPTTQSDHGMFLEMNAKREALEETGLEVGELKYLSSSLVNDWRYRGENSKIFSVLFSAKYTHGRAMPQDDIAELKWFRMSEMAKNLESFVETNIVPVHRNMVKTVFNAYSGH